jgi:iron complex transport system ATP-binding protein
MDIEIKGVKFSYGSKSVLKSLSFKMESGNIVGILGQNGCGKTTLLNCINTILKPTGGCVMIDDPGGLGEMDVQRMSSKDLAQHMATVAQTNSTSFPFTVMEAVKMGRYAQTRARDASDQDMDVIYNALERVGMLDFIDRNINELSGGELRRVMIARALVQEPDVMLLDEPTLHLDINNQFDLMDLMRELVDEKKILVVIVTHDLVLAARYCDQIVLMQKGEVVSIGCCADVITPENMRDVFFVDAEVSYSEAIHGLNVFIHGKFKGRGRRDISRRPCWPPSCAPPIPAGCRTCRCRCCPPGAPPPRTGIPGLTPAPGSDPAGEPDPPRWPSRGLLCSLPGDV